MKAYLVDQWFFMDRRPGQVWKQLDEVSQDPYETEDGRKLNIEVCRGSGGHHTRGVWLCESVQRWV